MRIALIGTNFVTDMFMAGAKLLDGCDVVAVCDVSMEKANAFADKYQIPLRYDSYEKLADKELTDAIYIATPNALHHDMSIYFLKRGFAVYCEKPMSANIQQVEEILEVATNNKSFVLEGLMPLYNPNFKILKDALDLVGPIHQVVLNQSQYSSRYDAYLEGKNPTTFRSELANGAIMDLGVYAIGVCVGLFGKPHNIVSKASLLDTGADVAGNSMFEYGDFIANVLYSKASFTNNKSEICGEHGTLRFNPLNLLSDIEFIDRKTKEVKVISEKVETPIYYVLKEMMEDLAKGHTEASKHPFDQIRAVHEVMSECRRQAKIEYPQDK
ncbi:MAG: Gfo/Idh/MocA family protein [Erysipelotrichaceae bacterium]